MKKVWLSGLMAAAVFAGCSSSAADGADAAKSSQEQTEYVETNISIPLQDPSEQQPAMDLEQAGLVWQDQWLYEDKVVTVLFDNGELYTNKNAADNQLYLVIYRNANGEPETVSVVSKEEMTRMASSVSQN